MVGGREEHGSDDGLELRRVQMSEFYMLLWDAKALILKRDVDTKEAIVVINPLAVKVETDIDRQTICISFEVPTAAMPNIYCLSLKEQASAEAELAKVLDRDDLRKPRGHR